MRKSTPLFFVCLIVLATFTSALEDGLLPIDPPFGCNPTLCKNGGKCEVEKIHPDYVGPNGPAPEYKCTCPPDWTGERCETWDGIPYFSRALSLSLFSLPLPLPFVHF